MKTTSPKVFKQTSLGLVGVCISAILSQACGQEEFYENSSQDVVAGNASFDRPEIGKLYLSNNALCTGSLIAPNVVITAAHCVDFRNSQNGNFGTFIIDENATTNTRYQIDAMQSYGINAGDDDIALLRLRTAVPESVAQPAQLSDRGPNLGDDVVIYGYGCTNRRPSRGSGTKRSLSTQYGDTSNLCPGDSGGPVVLASNGAIVFINSAYYVRSGRDIFGKPYNLYNDLQDQVRRWSNIEINPPDSEPTPPETEPTPPETEPTPPETEPTPPETEPAPPPRNCLGAESSAQAQLFRGAIDGEICSGRDSWFLVGLRRGETLQAQVEFDNDNGNVDMALYNRWSRAVGSSTSDGDRETIAYRPFFSGYYYLRIYARDGARNQVQGNVSVGR